MYIADDFLQQVGKLIKSQVDPRTEPEILSNSIAGCESGADFEFPERHRLIVSVRRPHSGFCLPESC
ncbi:MAG: hypothetical protein ACK48U_22825, partial [Planctomyces sp.]